MLIARDKPSPYLMRRAIYTARARTLAISSEYNGAA
jgi:hypothetical protein